jgi:arylformamidase
MRKIWDISQTLRPGIPVWPGDTAFACTPTWAIGDACPVNVASFSLSTHSGSHADAPLHYSAAGKAIADVDISRYIGRCRLIDVTSAGPVITPADCEAELTGGIERVLFRTCAKSPQNYWDENFKAIAPETVEMVASRGGLLIGTDTPSLDPQNSKSMAAHKAILRRDMSILEGLVLDGIPPGDYELIALPLKLAGLDASPLRAILRSY